MLKKLILCQILSLLVPFFVTLADPAQYAITHNAALYLYSEAQKYLLQKHKCGGLGSKTLIHVRFPNKDIISEEDLINIYADVLKEKEIEQRLLDDSAYLSIKYNKDPWSVMCGAASSILPVSQNSMHFLNWNLKVVGSAAALTTVAGVEVGAVIFLGPLGTSAVVGLSALFTTLQEWDAQRLQRPLPSTWTERCALNTAVMLPTAATFSAAAAAYPVATYLTGGALMGAQSGEALGNRRNIRSPRLPLATSR
ncbi:MAG: hypothetical protein HYS98_08085 [Deltaproteobacteria bacterium]|nr:hypothetical protein [Deltaproteobacteria bacterium]